jgi:hypothetical protein
VSEAKLPSYATCSAMTPRSPISTSATPLRPISGASRQNRRSLPLHRLSEGALCGWHWGELGQVLSCGGAIECLHLTVRSDFEQPIALERLVGVFCENPEEIEFARGECLLFAIAWVDQYALLKIQYPAAHAYPRSYGG